MFNLLLLFAQCRQFCVFSHRTGISLCGLVNQENGGHGGWPSGDKGVTLPIVSIAVAILLLRNSTFYNYPVINSDPWRVEHHI